MKSKRLTIDNSKHQIDSILENGHYKYKTARPESKTVEKRDGKKRAKSRSKSPGKKSPRRSPRSRSPRSPRRKKK